MKLKTVTLFLLMVFTSGCGAGKSANGGSTAVTQVQGAWTFTATNGVGGQSVFQVNLVSSACTVSTPIGTFTVQGASCSIADDNTGQGSISGTGSFFYPPAGVLVGLSSGQIELVFVEADQFGDAAVINGNGTLSSGAISGTWTCNAATSVCLGFSGTFAGTQN
jgi:hypothetical protein